MSEFEDPAKSGRAAQIVRTLRALARFLPHGDSFGACCSRRRAEDLFGNRVDIPVPATGLGPRLNWMRAWCETRLSPETWAMHGYHAGREGRRGHLVRFYFADPDAAESFSQAWGRSCAERGEQPNVIARTQAALSACLGPQGQGLYAF